MSDSAARPGLAARLISSAQGGVTALRPQLANRFAAEGGGDPPLLERTEQVAASAPAAPPRAENAPRALATKRATAEDPPFRLMPAEPALAQADADPAALPSDGQIEAGPVAATGSPPAPSSASPDNLAPPPIPTPPVRGEPRGDSLSAAVIQLLGTQSAAGETVAPAPPLRSDELATSRFAEPAATAPAATTRGGPGEQPPLQIHIGEIVIAPEPPAPLRERAPSPAWQPPLSLADYRASRARERE